MSFRIKDPEKIVRIATIATLSFMIIWGLVVVVAQITPFWVDEWRVIYNLKFKTATTIWGPLDFMQQFPRVYIEIIRAFTAFFDFSYFSLRFPSFLVGVCVIFFCYRLMNKLYGTGHFNRFLFVMILVSCSTFTGYFVEIKQYTMDLLLSLVAIWQLIQLLELKEITPANKKRYALLCLSFLIVPFFSYTYPVAIAPAYFILLVQSIYLLKEKTPNAEKRKMIFFKWFPLMLCAVSVVTFYIIDVSQLMRDQQMHEFWKHLLMDKGFSWQSFFVNFYMLFAEIGAGFVYWFYFGILGILSFIFGVRACVKAFNKNAPATTELIRLYSVVLLVLVITLFAFGKLPLGEPRLNAFTIPAISILIIYFLDTLKQKVGKGKFSMTLSVLLYAGLIGNIYTTFYASVTGPVYSKKMDIYRSTETAIVLAQAQKLPIFITPEVAYPYDKTLNYPFKNTIPGDWVLKTFPAYKVGDNIPVYAIADPRKLKEAINLLPANITSALVGDGTSFRIIKR